MNIVVIGNSTVDSVVKCVGDVNNNPVVIDKDNCAVISDSVVESKLVTVSSNDKNAIKCVMPKTVKYRPYWSNRGKR